MPGVAGFNFNDAAVMVKEEFESTFYRTFVRNNVFMELLNPTREEYVEKDIRWKLYYSGNPAAGSYSEDGDIGINRTDLGERFTTAQLDWKLNGVPIKVSGLAQAITQSPKAIIDAVGENTEQALKQLQANMNLQLLSDGAGNLNGVNPALNAGLDITGIQAAIDDGGDVPVYGGIDRTVDVYWQSFVLRNPLAPGTPRPLTEALMHQVMNELRQVRQGRVTHILCSPNVFTQYGLLLQGDRRYPLTGGGANRYVGGFEALKFDDVALVSVPLFEEGRMDFVDMDLLKYKILLDFTISPRDAGIRDANVMHAKTYSQFQCKNSFVMGSIRDLIV